MAIANKSVLKFNAPGGYSMNKLSSCIFY